jgi:hypothetical protein
MKPDTAIITFNPIVDRRKDQNAVMALSFTTPPSSAHHKMASGPVLFRAGRYSYLSPSFPTPMTPPADPKALFRRLTP